jgi:hypothetical protein
MAVQASSDLTNKPFVLHGDPGTESGYPLKQDAGRSGALAQYTALSFDSANLKWVPFTDETATDGTQIPTGISFSSATEAEIKAGDVSNFYVYHMGPFRFDQAQLTIENSKTLDTVVTVPTNQKLTVRQLLMRVGMVAVAVDAIDAVENA